MILYILLKLTIKIISDNLKRLLIKFLLQAVGGFKILSLVLKLAFKWIYRLCFFLYKYSLRDPVLAVYSLLHKIKKSWQYLPELRKNLNTFFSAYFSPLIALIIIGLIIIATNLNAQELRPEYYGQKSILFKILPSNNGEFYDEAMLDESDLSSEGPIDLTSLNTSYIEGVLAQDQPVDLANQGGIGSLISTTQDRSVLISPEITDPLAINKRRDKIIDYTVQPGDVASTIATRFGITTNTVLWENNLTIYSTLKIGRILKILPVTGITHKVVKGDTLKSIAAKFKGNADKILEFNKLENANEIQIGQTLIIPDGVPVTVTVAAPVYTAKNNFAPSTPAQISSSKLQWPTNSYYISQYYSWRHTGLDVANKLGQPVYAAEDGVVIKSGWNSGGYGYYIMIDHGNRLQTLYAHCSKLYVSVGQRVTRGQVIGAIGSTGRSTGSHLHFEVRINNVRVNPLNYIR